MDVAAVLPSADTTAIQSDLLADYMQSCREITLRELRELVPRGVRSQSGKLYELMLDYPLREGKALRPALAIATCRALGGGLESIARSAAVLELYHNAFLIHDDVEDGSEKRRDQPTLHRKHGVAVAINVGDAMLALALEPLLDNMRIVGMGSALRVLSLVARMARESAEGQALELDWIHSGDWQLSDRDYLRMVYKKTSWYTFIAPMMMGAITAGLPKHAVESVGRLAILMGSAFQIQDDVLNLVGDERLYGKEILGDLWEGKHTLILLHALRHASAPERAHAEALLRKPRPSERASGSTLQATLDALLASGELTPVAAAAIRAAGLDADARTPKTEQDIAFLLDLIHRHGSIDYARDLARTRAARARRTLVLAMPWKRPSTHFAFIDALITYIAERDR
jgi:geranylgeranyl diphosphate synthase, type II